MAGLQIGWRHTCQGREYYTRTWSSKRRDLSHCICEGPRWLYIWVNPEASHSWTTMPGYASCGRSWTLYKVLWKGSTAFAYTLQFICWLIYECKNYLWNISFFVSVIRVDILFTLSIFVTFHTSVSFSFVLSECHWLVILFSCSFFPCPFGCLLEGPDPGGSSLLTFSIYLNYFYHFDRNYPIIR